MAAISELFVSLGVKNGDKTISTITSVRQGLTGVVDSSLALKAALVGAMYSLEHLMSESAGRGTALSNFNALTGISTKQLQQWQFAAQQAGESNEDFSNSLKSVFDKMKQLEFGGGVPEKFGVIAGTVGLDMKRAFNDVFYLYGKLQEFTKSKVDIGLQNQALKGLGLSETAIAALRKGVFTETNFSRAPKYSEGQINALNQVDVMWRNLNQKIFMHAGSFTSKYGAQIVNGISHIVDTFFQFVSALIKLGNAVHLSEGVVTALKIITDIISGITKFIIESIDLFSKISNTNFNKNDDAFKFIVSIFDMIKSIIKFMSDALFMPDVWKNVNTDIKNQDKNIKSGKTSLENEKISAFGTIGEGIGASLQQFLMQHQSPQNTPNNIIPFVPGTTNNLTNSNSNQNTTNNTTINQNLHFNHDGKDDHSKIKDTHRKSINDAYKQLSAQSQAT